MTQRLNIDIVARDKSKRALTTLQGSLGRLKQSIFNVRNAFIGLGAGLVVRNIINTGKQIESLQVRLKFLFGTAEEGAKAFDEMAKFASKVPFSLEEIQAGSGVLAVVSEDAKEMAKLMKITGNVAAVTGLDFRTTAEQIQRSMSAGISAADLFRDRGVKAMLGFKAGATVSIEETVKAFDRVFGEGGEFDGATDQLAKTFEGTLSMIGDKVFNFKRVLLDAGFFSQLKKQFGDLNKSLEKNSETMDKIAVTIGTVLAVAVERVVAGFKFLAKYSDEVAFAFKVIISLKIGAMLIRWARALVPIVASMRALVSLSGVGVKLVAASFAASVATFLALNNELDELEKKINSNFEAQKKAYDPTMLLDQLGSHKEVTKELEKQAEVTRNIFEENNKLIEAVKKAEEISKERMKSSFNIFESHRQLEDAVKRTNDKLRNMKEILRDLNNKEMEAIKTIWEKIQTVIAEGINEGIKKTSDALARSIILGEKLAESFKRMAQDIAIKILSTLIEIVIRKGVELALEKLITREKLKQHALDKKKGKTNLFNTAMSFFGFGKQSGGAVSKGKPVIIGERGPELFVPNSTGQIQQNARGTGGESVNVNFNIEAIDSNSFNDVLVENRGIITSIINNALNEKGRRELV